MTGNSTFPQASVPGRHQNYIPELPETIPNETIYSYNLDDRKKPGGLKVRFKVRIATGPEGARWDARLDQAIKELLQWAQRHPRSTTPAR
jgi:hypothetical protein